MDSIYPLLCLSEVIESRKDFIEIDDFKDYKRCRVQLNAHGIVLRDQVGGAEIRTKRQQVCRAGDFLVAEIDAKLGGYGIVPTELEGAVVSSHYFLFSIDEAKLERNFLRFYIQTPDFLSQIIAQGSTNYAAIRSDHVLSYRIPLPPLSEQRRIVARIEELAGKIEEAKRLRVEATGELSRVERCWTSTILDKLKVDGTLKDVLVEPPKNGVSFNCDNIESGHAILSLSAVTFSFR